MSIEFVVGDLFGQPDLDALGHGVNCKGVMGSGIAPIFKRRHPQMFEEYRRLCLNGSLTLGNYYPYYDPETPEWVYNLASQHDMGSNADLDAVASSVNQMLVHARANGVSSIGLPRIGSGIGGLDWGEVKQVLSRLASHHDHGEPDVLIRVVSLPGA